MLINLLYSSIVISGKLVPAFQDGEDIIAITLSIIQKLSGVTIRKAQVNNCHRMGKKLILEFAKAGTCSPLQKVIFQSKRLKMREAGTWINIHMTPHDSHIFFVARQMKNEGIFVFVGSSLGAPTKVRVKDSQEDHIINTVAELQKFTTKPISYFEEKRGVPLDDSGVMDTE